MNFSSDDGNIYAKRRHAVVHMPMKRREAPTGTAKYHIFCTIFFACRLL